MSSFIRNIFIHNSAANKLREAALLVADSLKQLGYPERVQDVYDNIEHNESGLALETLCENLYEFSCPIPQRAYDLLREAGTDMKIDSKYWEMLKSQIIS